jgi:integrase/recombinase XerD
VSPTLAAYAAHLRLDLGLSERTIASYAGDLAQLEKQARKPAEALTEHDLAKALSEWRAEKVSTRTIHRRLSAVRSLVEYLREEDPEHADPTARLEVKSERRKLPKTVPQETMRKILAQPDVETPEGLRDRALLELLYASGLRVSEAATLKRSQLQLKERIVRAFGKGAKERLVPFHESAAAWLARYLEEEYPKLNPGFVVEEVFVTTVGKPRALTRQEIWLLVRAHAKNAGVKEAISPHMFRHSFASHLLEGGMNLRSVQALLGHADISTTQVYTDVEEARLVEAHRKFHPRK